MDSIFLALQAMLSGGLRVWKGFEVSGEGVGAVGVAHDEAQAFQLQQALQQRSLLAVAQSQSLQLLHPHA